MEWIAFYDAYKDFLHEYKKKEGGNISEILSEREQRGLKKLICMYSIKF